MDDDEDWDEGVKKINFQSKWGNTENLANMVPSIGVGIAELIKNSYDADAKNVLVDLRGGFEENLARCKIMITDDGHGMSEQDLQNWFDIGDSNKKRQDKRYSPKGRLTTGDKGIGRFACKQISKSVTLITKAPNSPTLNITIEWDIHDDSANMEDVEFRIYRNHKEYKSLFPKPEQSGTILILEHLREKLDNQLQVIHRNVHTLVNPFSDIDGFEIDLRTPTSKKKWEDIGTKHITQFAQYSFIANIDSMGKNIEWDFENKHPWSMSQGKKSGSWRTTELLEGDKCSINNTKIMIYFLGRDSKLKNSYTTSTGKISKDALDKLCGFKLYRGKHRIYPYGEIGGPSSENGDWLGLTTLNSNNSTNYFRHANLVAAAEVHPQTNPKIIDMANRTGLQETPEKTQLITLLRAVVKKMRTELCNPLPTKPPKEMQPPEFHYKMSIMGKVGDNLSVKPTIKTSQPTTWSIKPELPNGIVFDSRDGVISGTPTEVMDEQISYIVSGANQFGKNAYQFHLQIYPDIDVTAQPQDSNPTFTRDIIEADDFSNSVETSTETKFELDNIIKVNLREAKSTIHFLSAHARDRNEFKDKLIQLKNQIEEMINNV